MPLPAEAAQFQGARRLADAVEGYAGEMGTGCRPSVFVVPPKAEDPESLSRNGPPGPLSLHDPPGAVSATAGAGWPAEDCRVRGCRAVVALDDNITARRWEGGACEDRSAACNRSHMLGLARVRLYRGPESRRFWGDPDLSTVLGTTCDWILPAWCAQGVNNRWDSAAIRQDEVRGQNVQTRHSHSDRRDRCALTSCQ